MNLQILTITKIKIKQLLISESCEFINSKDNLIKEQDKLIKNQNEHIKLQDEHIKLKNEQINLQANLIENFKTFLDEISIKPDSSLNEN